MLVERFQALDGNPAVFRTLPLRLPSTGACIGWKLTIHGLVRSNGDVWHVQSLPPPQAFPLVVKSLI